MCAALIGCAGNGNSNDSGAGSNPDIGLLNDTAFKVGVEIGYPPFEMFDDSGEPIGFDIDLAAEIAGILGVKVEYHDTAWDGIFAGVERGDYDCIISSVSITPARQERYLLTEPYIANALCIVVKK
jgi:ABC-type amino acid transport substrate-binding protein